MPAHHNERQFSALLNGGGCGVEPLDEWPAG